MRVAELMTKHVETVSPEMPAIEAWEVMRTKGIHHLVAMAEGAVVGLLSAQDAGGRNGATLRAHTRVADLMTPSVVTIEPSATIRRAANLMRGRTIGCLPVVDRGRLVGVLTVSDLLELLGRGVDRPAAPVRRGLHHRVAHRKQPRGSGVW